MSDNSLPIIATLGRSITLPLQYAGTLMICSIPWLMMTLLFSWETATHRQWSELGPSLSSSYEFRTYGIILAIAQLFFFLCFFVIWARVNYSGEGPAQELVQYGLKPYLAKLANDATMVGGGLLAIAAKFCLFSLMLGVAVSMFGSKSLTGGIIAIIALVILGRNQCGIAPYLASKAIAEDPLTAVRASERVEGHKWRICFFIYLPSICFIFLKLILQAEIGQPHVEGAFWHWSSIVPIWDSLSPKDSVSFLLIFADSAMNWLFYTWLIAMMTLIYRHLSPPRGVDMEVAAIF